MSTELMAKLFQLIQLKKFNEKLNQKQQLMNDLCKGLIDFELSGDSVVDDIKTIRTDVPFIESKKKSKKFKCLRNNCGFKCRLRIQLKKHRLSHKYDKRFKCNECQKEFHRFNHLKSHQLIHSNERQFVCVWSECGKRFKRKSALNRHKRVVHLKEKKFECDYENCEKKFICNNDLIQHKRIHSGEKPFICVHQNCGKRFTLKSGLIQHKRVIHLNERSFKCDFKDCEKRFGKYSNLIQHKRIHMREKPFVCVDNNCGKRFAQKSHLNKHNKSIHLKQN